MAKYITGEDYELEEDIDHLPRAKRIPTNWYEYCVTFSQLLNKPKGYVLGRMKGVEEKHLAHAYADITSDHRRTKEQKQKLAMYWLKNLQPK